MNFELSVSWDEYDDFSEDNFDIHRRLAPLRLWKVIIFIVRINSKEDESCSQLTDWRRTRTTMSTDTFDRRDGMQCRFAVDTWHTERLTKESHHECKIDSQQSSRSCRRLNLWSLNYSYQSSGSRELICNAFLCRWRAFRGFYLEFWNLFVIEFLSKKYAGSTHHKHFSSNSHRIGPWSSDSRRVSIANHSWPRLSAVVFVFDSWLM